MPSSRELLNNPEFQTMLVKNAERWFNLERVLAQPTVIFDYGVTDFWTTAMNSPKKDQVLEKISAGEIIPINADALTDISQVHSALHVYLAESDKNIPTIPTLVNIDGNRVWVGKYNPPREIRGVFVKKVSYQEDGRSLSHRGEGVSIVRITQDNKNEHLPKNRWEFLQPFIVPPDEFVRDIRVYLVGGKPVAGVIRCARKPLLPENLTGEILPTKEQYPSAEFPGLSQHLSGELKDKVFSQTSRVYEVLNEKVRSRKRPFSSYSTLGFGAIDFLLDANGAPLPVDFDIGPSVTIFEDIDKIVVKNLAELLAKLAKVNGIQRKVLLIGYPKDSFLTQIIQYLKGKMSAEEIIFQDTVVIQAVRELSSPKKSDKIGRNEPCPCGSGKKFKKCHGF